MDWSAAIPGALAGALTGTVSSLISPWAHWAVEQRRGTLAARRARIAEWRREADEAPTYLERGVYASIADIPSFGQLRALMTEEETGTTNDVPRMRAVIDRVEREWDLI